MKKEFCTFQLVNLKIIPFQITGYSVEMREYGSNNWYIVSDYNITNPEFTVPNLKVRILLVWGFGN